MRRLAVSAAAPAALSVALAVLLGGCSPPAAVGPVAVYDARGRHYEANVLDGTIRISEGCMTVRWQGDDVVLMFPADEVTWDAEAAAFTYGGTAYGDGDAISLEAIVHFGRTSGTVPEACPPSVRVYVLEEGLD
jgi:hypothetical protein